jgi:hypothetical protein
MICLLTKKAEKKRGQSAMMPRHHPETMKLNKVISWQSKKISFYKAHQAGEQYKRLWDVSI